MKGRSWHMHRRCSWEKWIMLPSVLSQPTLQSIGLVSYLTSDLLLKISIIQPTLSFWPSEIWGKKSIVREEINQTFWRIYTSEWWRRNCTIIWEKTCFTVSNIPLNKSFNQDYVRVLFWNCRVCYHWIIFIYCQKIGTSTGVVVGLRSGSRLTTTIVDLYFHYFYPWIF